MFRFAPYLLKSLWRHRARTALTVSGAAVAMFVFAFIGAANEGLGRLTRGDDSLRRLVVFQENRFCPASSRLPEDYARTIEEVAGVEEVLPIQVWTNNCRASLDVVVFHGAAPDKLRSARSLQVIDGSWSAFASRSDGAIVGRSVAGRRRLKVGDTFSIGSLSVHVAGVFSSPVASEESLIYTHLDFLQRTQGSGNVGQVTQFEVRLREGADPDRVAREIDAALRAGAVATTTRLKGAFQASTLSDLVDLVGFAHWLGLACVGLVLSIVATTTVMSVQDRVKEHAILQTIGLRPGRVFRLILAESALLCLAGGALGTAAALALLALSGLAVGAEGVAVAFEPSWRLAALGMLVSLGVGVAAGVLPAWGAMRAPLVEALRG